MFDLAIYSFRLLLRGKLFRDPTFVLGQGMAAAAITAAAIIVIAKVGAPLSVAAVVGGFAGGWATPFLFKNLKAA